MRSNYIAQLIRQYISKSVPVILLLAIATYSHAAPKVAVSIPPIHSIVANILDGVTTPALLIEGGQSPHTASLAPSTIKTVNNADLIVWVGPTLETALTKAINQIDPNQKITLLEIESIEHLETRIGQHFGEHDHGHKEHDDHADDHDDGYEDNINTIDPHLWLSPHNAEAIAQSVANWLIKNDPNNAAQYKDNTAKLLTKITNLESRINQALTPIRDNQKKWMVFHDAYQYFEHEFGLTPISAITLTPEQSPGAKRIKTLRDQIKDAGVECLFIEPQFKPSAAKTIAEGTNIRIETLDPIGADISSGKQHWFQLMEQLSDQLTTCLLQR